MSSLHLTRDELKRDVRKVVTYCAMEIRASGGIVEKRPPNKNELHQAAVAMMVDLVELKQRIAHVGDPTLAAELYQNADELASNLHTVMLQAGTSEKTKGRSTVHELATKLQRDKVAADVYGVDQVVCRTLDGRRVRHHIARRVEEVLFDDGSPAEF